MSIKRRDNSPAAAKPEGCLVMSPEQVPVVRCVLADRSISYVASTLTRWELALKSGETLTIDAGADQIVVVGSGLAIARDALDTGRLEELRLLKRRRMGDEPWIAEITIEQR